MASPAGEGGATARALRAESRTPPSALMEGPGLPRQGGARSDTGPGGAGWRGRAGRWLLSSAAPAPLNTPRPTWRTLNLDWPPLSANPSATAIPTLHRAGARAQRRPGESARSAGTGARARERGRARSGRAAGTGRCWRGAAAPRGTPSRVGRGGERGRGEALPQRAAWTFLSALACFRAAPGKARSAPVAVMGFGWPPVPRTRSKRSNAFP